MRATVVLAVLAGVLTAGCIGGGTPEPEVVAVTATPAPKETPVPTATSDVQATSQADLSATPTQVAPTRTGPSPVVVTPVPTTPTPATTQIPNSDITPPTTPLPDLVIEIEARLIPNPRIEWGDRCIVSSSSTLPWHLAEITAHVRNVGGGHAGNFTVQVNNAVTEIVDGLKAGAYTDVVFSTRPRSEYVAVVDAGSLIDESDESNNTAETFMEVPTLVAPAPTCTPKSG